MQLYAAVPVRTATALNAKDKRHVRAVTSLIHTLSCADEGPSKPTVAQYTAIWRHYFSLRRPFDWLWAGGHTSTPH